MNAFSPTPSPPFHTLPDLYDAYIPRVAKVLDVAEKEVSFPPLRRTHVDRPGEKPGLPHNWYLTVHGRSVAYFALSPLPGCCGVVVSHGAGVDPLYQGKGLGGVLNAFRIDLARLYGYGMMLCTDVTSNDRQRAILKTNGWTDVHTFINPRTTNEIALSVINLRRSADVRRSYDRFEAGRERPHLHTPPLPGGNPGECQGPPSGGGVHAPTERRGSPDLPSDGPR